MVKIMTKDFLITSDQDMQNLGYHIGLNAFPNMLITMEGDLGAGKTTMTKGIGRALEVKKIINSPTFTIMKVYEGKLTLYHMDVYRIDNNSGDDYLEEYFESGGVCVVEWANNISDLIKDDHLEIDIKIDENFNRVVTLKAQSLDYEKVIEAINL